jgi:hypothetical protein
MTISSLPTSSLSDKLTSLITSLTSLQSKPIQACINSPALGSILCHPLNFPLAHTFIPMLNPRYSVNVTTSYPLTSKFGSHEAVPVCLCCVLFADSSTMLNAYRCNGHPKAKHKMNIKLSLCTPSGHLV